MLQKIIDLHIHSKYSRACSKDLELPKIAQACQIKGVDIVATADFTHPAWFEHIKENLIEDNQGIYRLKDNSSLTRFILSTEISCIYKHKEAVRRLHLVLLAPNLKAVEKFNQALEKRGVNIRSDGRPIMGLSAKEILQIMLAIDPDFMMIPAHAWTPWFAIFGSKSGYDRLEDCFEELTPRIRAIETGLSSDPPMNRRLSALDKIVLVSNSDAHSLDKIGREANVLAFDNPKDINFLNIKKIIESGDRDRFLHTIEFYPEEGKYHCDGHRDCRVCLTPLQTKKANYLCPKCKKKLTVGVLHRVDDLADRNEDAIPKNIFVPHKYIVPLREIIGYVFGVGPKSKKVDKEYQNMIKKIGHEFFILLSASEEQIKKNISDGNIWLAIANTRSGNVILKGGYDGEFGQVNVLPQGANQVKQKKLF
ncbi:MAG: DNA helicase UvrD [Candidatus Magasanikbacteria bacterium CG10_big_fil_rev_8_21_14_0_10_40_10]|uniref:DNA helicase UvrD n=1 Tax=Candidatus Magasanikbacteria bacterium CG10_big_fil_rev_8_21_14_0_10_40_10 TaxID=1974648 RepID=A0A2M6W4H0_9BACT|nr:MAG: DNA helicase UvrD [Candidatus Magasanikbacteria bacterium CG10_big_fil_rev_8_21_14_0_10_40_10]